MPLPFLCLLLSLARADAPASPPDAPPGVSLAEAERLAQTAATGVAVAEANQIGAGARLDQAKTARLPSLSVSGSVDVWNDAQTVTFIPPEAGVDCSTFPVEMIALCAAFSTPITVRDQVTASLSVRVIEPLTGQLLINKSVEAAHAVADASAAATDNARLDAKAQADDAWLLAAQAERQLDIATAQVRSLNERVAAAQTAYRDGALTRNDLLLATLAQANAAQAVIQATLLRDMAYNRLGVVIGNGGLPVRPVGASDDPPRAPPDADALIAKALQTRPDLAALRARVSALDASAGAASLSRVPQLTAMGVYTHSEGNGLFAEKNSGFVGANLDWAVWSWGQKTLAMKAARADADAAQAQIAGAEAGLRAEVRGRVEALHATASAYAVATSSIDQAEESLRIQEKRHDVGAATMTELLDAESALVRAKSSQANALTDARRAEAALERAVGADLW